MAFLVVCSVFASLLNVAVADENDGITSYTQIPQAPDDDNSTVTNSTNIDDNSTISDGNTTYVYVDSNRIDSINPMGAPQRLFAYNRTTVNLVFASCLSCAVNVTSDGDWTDSRDSAGQITFFPEELGEYELHFQVLYDRVVNQTITLTVYGGDGVPQELNLVSVNRGFTLDIILTVLELPTYPSADEIADANNAANQQMYNRMQAQNEKLLIESNTWSKTALVAVAIGLPVIAIVIFLIIRHQRHEDSRINDLNANGFGRGRE